MKTFEQYLEDLRDRRDEDEYPYTDDDFSIHQNYIRRCFEQGLSVYKCLEFMYYEK